MNQLDEAYLHDLVAPLRERWQAEGRQLGHAKRDELEQALEERDQKIRELQDQEVQLRLRESELAAKNESFELETQRIWDEALAQLRPEEEARARKKAEAELLRRDRDQTEQLRRQAETHQEQLSDRDVRIRQLEDQLKRVNGDLEIAQRRSSSGNRQLEGFAAQDLFGEQLARRFADDEITKIPRGVTGADFHQVVRAGTRRCGGILWEYKRAANWGGDRWVSKLTADARAANVMIAVIVSRKLPAGIEGFGQIGDNLWVCDGANAWALGEGLRQAVIAVSWYEIVNARRADAEGRVYDWLATSGEFEAMCKHHQHAVDGLTAEIDGLEERRMRLISIRNVLCSQGPLGIGLALLRLGANVPPAVQAQLGEGHRPLALPTA